MTKMEPAVPILFVRDAAKSTAFFEAKLGFAIDFLYGDPPFYGSVSRDNACLHLREVREPNFADLAAQEKSLILATIEVSHVQALFEDFKSRCVNTPRCQQSRYGAGLTSMSATLTETSSPLWPTKEKSVSRSRL